MTWTDTHTALAYLVSPAGLVLAGKGAMWVRRHLRDREAARIAEAVATAQRHAEEAAHRARMAERMDYVVTRVDDAHEGIAELRGHMDHVRGRLDERDAHGRSGCRVVQGGE